MSHEEETPPKNTVNSRTKNNIFANRNKLLTDYFHVLPKNNTTITMVSKKIQVDDDLILEDKLIKNTSDGYWRMLAEEKRIELEDALMENARLYQIKEKLIKQINTYKEMLDEASSVISVFKEVVEDNADDTGIGLADDESGEE